jgi:hypothetical protein
LGVLLRAAIRRDDNWYSLMLYTLNGLVFVVKEGGEWSESDKEEGEHSYLQV